MGRCKKVKKPFLRKNKYQEHSGDYCLTPEEVRRSIQRWSFLWRYFPDSDSDIETQSSSTTKFALKDLKEYGDWTLKEKFDIKTTGRDILMNLSKLPYPDIIKPPVSYASQLPNTLRVNSPPYITHKIFEYVLPEICEKAKEFMEPPKCEGAVGYDLRYFDTPIMIKPLCVHHKPQPLVSPQKNVDCDNWMDGRHSAKLLVELNQPLVDYNKLRRCSMKKKPNLKRNKLLCGLPKKSVRQHFTRWLRPRAKIVFNSELEGIEKQWEVCEEEQLPSDDYYVEHVNDELDLETEQSYVSSLSEDFIPQVTRSQSDLTLDYLRTQPIIRRCHSLDRI
ncbi:uncharacterized protein LOC108104943 [Drosophila eugracilis]|uniref:uncharacterized protein LOC108104943 n=1 Tax=Drosophila eugracilis TaxID=29029 RepID=UPI0007E6F1AF|nr:uncharacterized protein LOC108104943 [Drosophila eugracilis]